MRRFIGSFVIAASFLSGCAGPEGVGAQRAALTGTDVDVASECQGIIGYANAATFAELDAFLPSNVASNIVAHRTVTPFTSLADILSVDQVADYRLGQIEQAARQANWIGPSCVGILDQVAVSTDDAQAMVELVNTISWTELHDILPNAWNGAENLLLTRPFSQVQSIASTSGIGAVSFRAIRNAATLSRPFEQLAAAVNAANRNSTLLRHFDWYHIAHYSGRYSLNGLTCFGIDPARLPNGAEIRPNLATPAEILSEVNQAVTYANRYNPNPIDPTAGIANLEQLTAGRTFFGCYVSYADDPWSGNNLSFFVDPTTGFGVLTETRWSE
jgi:hypothetical protein